MIEELYQELIYKIFYARWVESLKRRENWEESVKRFENFLIKKIKNKDAKKEFKKACDLILDKKIMPSMRAFWTAGKALERDNVAAYNPVAGDTEVLTKEYGLIPIKLLKDKKATILNIEERWTEAEFHSYGTQDLIEVEFKLNSNTINKIKCGKNHRWVLLDNSVVSTETLKVGDKIKFVSHKREKIDENNTDYRLGIQHGIIYGDGAATYSTKRLSGYVLRICNDKKDILKWFSEYPTSYPESYNGDPIVYMFSDFAKTHLLKELPNKNETEEYLIGFIRGWLASDGSISKTSQISIAVGRKEIDWFYRVGEKLGYIIQSEYEYPKETNLGKRIKKLFALRISRSSFVKEDFIIKRKRERFKSLTSYYFVSDKRILDVKEEVFCAEVPDTNTFTLKKGLITGNCCFVAVDNIKVFSEILYILMCGTGVGFSVEGDEINRLPELPDNIEEVDETIIFADSKRGWAEGYNKFLKNIYKGVCLKYDLSKLRPEGASLKTFGGRASGPAPLESLLENTKKIVMNAKGRKLYPVECHDIICHIASAIVSGGVRRSACISLSDLSDDTMSRAKTGEFWHNNPQRRLTNNSAVYNKKPDVVKFMDEWKKLIESRCGERGIFNRIAARYTVAKTGRRDPEYKFGSNPCSEIILRPKSFCNLSEVILRSEDEKDDIIEKVRHATIIGCIQSTLTDFNFIGKKYKDNCKDERLLGVSLTGLSDHPVLNTVNKKSKKWLHEMKEEAIETARKWSEILGIKMPASITCVKPSGTVSQLVGCSSGIHPRYAPYYIRRIRLNSYDPIAKFLIEEGINYSPETGQSIESATTLVFDFYIKSPKESILKDSVTAIQQLEYWKMIKEYWCEHNPSCTIYVKDDEWLEVASWVYKNWNIVCGLSFLPYDTGVYQLSPFEEIDEETYTELSKNINLDFGKLIEYEKEDTTTGAQEFACVGGTCEL